MSPACTVCGVLSRRTRRDISAVFWNGSKPDTAGPSRLWLSASLRGVRRFVDAIWVTGTNASGCGCATEGTPLGDLAEAHSCVMGNVAGWIANRAFGTDAPSLPQSVTRTSQSSCSAQRTVAGMR